MLMCCSYQASNGLSELASDLDSRRQLVAFILPLASPILVDDEVDGSLTKLSLTSAMDTSKN